MLIFPGWKGSGTRYSIHSISIQFHMLTPPETNITPENTPSQKEVSCYNPWFSVAMLVSGRYNYFTFIPLGRSHSVRNYPLANLHGPFQNHMLINNQSSNTPEGVCGRVCALSYPFLNHHMMDPVWWFDLIRKSPLDVGYKMIPGMYIKHLFWPNTAWCCILQWYRTHQNPIKNYFTSSDPHHDISKQPR